MSTTDQNLQPPVQGEEHWASKGECRLFLWRKHLQQGASDRGTVLFVHGSSMASTPTFDLQVEGRSSAMDWFARQGYDTWCVDMEGYGRSDKERNCTFDIANGAEDLAVASDYIMHQGNGDPLLVYGISSGALRAGLFAQQHPHRVKRLALDALVWTGEGSPTLANRRRKLPQFMGSNRRPINKAFVQSIFARDHVATTEQWVVDAFADAITALDDSIPNGTYIDMCSKLPILDPLQIKAPTIVMRGQYDGIASLEDLLAFFTALPNPDKQFTIMPGISHASFQQKNYLLVYHILHSFYSLPDPVYRGE